MICHCLQAAYCRNFVKEIHRYKNGNIEVNNLNNKDMSKLENKIALVTGGSRGIGAAIVRRLAEDGADVAFTFASDKEKANALVAEIEKIGRKAIAIQADSANAEAVEAAVEKTVTTFGKLDILVNNAGVLAIGPIAEFKLEDFDKTIDVNVRAVFVAIKAAAKYLVSGGRIINIGSINADRMPFQGGGVYAMSKAAIKGLTKGLARDFGPLGITINNIQPGPVDTDMNPASGEFADYLTTLLSVGRYGKGEEIAALAAYIASPESAYMNGSSVDIDGGFGN